VHGIVRRSSSFNTGRIDHIYKDRHETGVKIFLHYGDLCDTNNLTTLIANIKPCEIYNLGAMSHVKVSFDMPEYTAECDAVGVLRLLDAIRSCGMEKTVKFYQASTSELYGKVQEVPQVRALSACPHELVLDELFRHRFPCLLAFPCIVFSPNTQYSFIIHPD